MSSPASGKTIFTSEMQGNVLVVAAQAEISSLQFDIDDQMTAVLTTLQQTGARNLLLDLQRSGYFGTAMLGAMVKVWKKVSQGGGQMALCNVSDGIQEVLRLTKLQTLWPIHANREAALRALNG